ncbi:MAG: glycosyltransferase [Myxococcota bacterium]
MPRPSRPTSRPTAASQVTPRLTLCVIARDEEQMLPGCLASVRGIVDEIVVLDTGSVDDTARIARGAGATVVPFVWADDFAAARNAALAAAHGSWILVLDADERLAPGAGAAIQAVMRRGAIDCGLLPLHDATTLDALPADVLAGRARRGEPTLLPRLLRRTPDLKWEGVVHESVKGWLTAGKRVVGPVDAAIVHYGAVPELRAARAKDARNLRLLERRCELEPDSAVARTYLARELLRAGDVPRAAAEAERAWAAYGEELARGERPSVVPLVTLRAHLLLDEDRPTDVLALLDAARAGSAHPNLDLFRGLALERLGELDLAVAALEAARARHGEAFADEIVPGATSWAADVRIGLVHLAAGRPDAAAVAFTRALTSPLARDANLGLAETALLAGRPGDTLRAVEPLLGDGADAWILAAAACDAMGLAAERRAFLGRGVALPLGAPHRRARLLALRALDAAAECLTTLGVPVPGAGPAVEGPSTIATLAERVARFVVTADAHADAGDAAAALADWIRALRLAPSCGAAWIAIVATLQALGEDVTAVAVGWAARRILPEDAEVVATLAHVLMAVDAGEAARMARRALVLEPGHSVAEGVLDTLGVHAPVAPRVLPDPAIDALLAGAPLVTVIVPTFGRPEPLRNLLDRLSLQDLDPRAFEVIVVDDGSPTPVTDTGPRPYALTLLRQANAGPASARNLALRHARGRYVLIYNDDTLPEPDGVRRHLHAQLASTVPEAVLGTFDFLPEHREDPFVALLAESDLLFGYTTMRAGERYGWQHFWTCNLSVPRAALVTVGGFDPTFLHALSEDVELGYRLEKSLGMGVRYRPDIRAGHDHKVRYAGWLERQERLGHETWRIYTKHKDPALMPGLRTDLPDDTFWMSVRASVEQAAPERERLATSVGAALRRGSPAKRDERQKLLAAARESGLHRYRLGLVEATAHLPVGTRPRPLPVRATTSVIIPNLNGFPHVRPCLETLRRTTTGPIELVVVDNGSNDGSLEWLRTQPDVRLLEMGRNLGAPAARNRGLAVASGERVLFCDNDVLFTPRWQEILVTHLDAWPDIGMVGPVSDYVVDSQKAARLPHAAEALDDYAAALHTEQRGRHAYTSQLILFFILARREVIERIGGIDEVYGRWGFEDNDWSLRARLAGYRLRIARDCFIRHLGSRTSKTANIDYRSLLLENWEVFKRKWGLDPALPYGKLPLEGVLARGFDPARDFVAFR